MRELWGGILALFLSLGAAPHRPVAVLPRLSAVHMLGREFGIAVQDRPFALLTTDDGGTRWTVRAGPFPHLEFAGWGFGPSGPPWVQARPPLRAIGVQPGFAPSGPSRLWILRGLRWHRQRLPGSTGSVQGIVGSTIFAAAARRGSAALVLERGANDGARWRAVRTRLAWDTAMGNPVFTGAAFLTSHRAWAVGITGGGGWYAFATRDGGRSWEAMSLSATASERLAQTWLAPPVFCTKTVGVLPVGMPVAPSLVYETRNGGATWHLAARTAATLPTVGCTATGVPWVESGGKLDLLLPAESYRIPLALRTSGVSLALQSAVSPTVWIASADDGAALYRTRDAGARWTRIWRSTA